MWSCVQLSEIRAAIQSQFPLTSTLFISRPSSDNFPLWSPTHCPDVTQVLTFSWLRLSSPSLSSIFHSNVKINGVTCVRWRTLPSPSMRASRRSTSTPSTTLSWGSVRALWHVLCLLFGFTPFSLLSTSTSSFLLFNFYLCLNTYSLIPWWRV